MPLHRNNSKKNHVFSVNKNILTILLPLLGSEKDFFSITKNSINMNRFEQLKDHVMALEADFDKFYSKGNSAAGTRVRKGMQDLKNLAQEIRVEVQDKKNQG